MSDAITFSILGEPVAKGRPFFSSFKGRFVAITPKKTRHAEADVRAQVIAQLPKGFKPFEQPLNLEARIFRARPKSAPKRVIHPATRPDLDNYLKLYIDAMNSIVFKDDAQIVHIEASKEFVNSLVETPCAVITIREATQ